MTRVENVSYGHDSIPNPQKRIEQLEAQGFSFVGARSEFPEDLIDKSTKSLKPGVEVVINPEDKYRYAIYMKKDTLNQFLKEREDNKFPI